MNKRTLNVELKNLDAVSINLEKLAAKGVDLNLIKLNLCFTDYEIEYSFGKELAERVKDAWFQFCITIDNQYFSNIIDYLMDEFIVHNYRWLVKDCIK